MYEEKQREIIKKFFDPSLPRLGPGSSHYTRKALDMLLSAGSKQIAERLRILDIGCGNGAQTICLAKYIEGTILAVDNHQPFLDELQRRAEKEGVSEKITPCLKDMCNLGLEEESFDIIWSEGAIYNIGFREGLEAFRSLLVPGGLMAVSELCWLRPDPPEECRQYITEVYPPIVDIDTNLSTIESCGYKVIGHFIFSDTVWWDSFYHPMEDRVKVFRKEYAGVPGHLEMADSMELEIDQFRKYSNFWGYAFYMMQREGN